MLPTLLATVQRKKNVSDGSAMHTLTELTSEAQKKGHNTPGPPERFAEKVALPGVNRARTNHLSTQQGQKGRGHGNSREAGKAIGTQENLGVKVQGWGSGSQCKFRS